MCLDGGVRPAGWAPLRGVLDWASGSGQPDPLLVLAVPVAAHDLDVVRAVAAVPPGPDAPVSLAWMHWGLCSALRAAEPDGAPVMAEPDADWIAWVPWPVLTHRLALLAALAVPGQRCVLAAHASGRVADLARGFARAVRRRDWLQAAGAGRWLTVLGNAPDSLGLEEGLGYVQCLVGADQARTRVHLEAARLISKVTRR